MKIKKEAPLHIYKKKEIIPGSVSANPDTCFLHPIVTPSPYFTCICSKAGDKPYYADGYPYLLLSTQSIDKLNHTLKGDPHFICCNHRFSYWLNDRFSEWIV